MFFLSKRVLSDITGDTQWQLEAQKGADGQWKWIDGIPFGFQRFAQTSEHF